MAAGTWAPHRQPAVRGLPVMWFGNVRFSALPRPGALSYLAVVGCHCRGRCYQFGEIPYWPGELGYFGVGGGESCQGVGFLRAQVLGVGEQEPRGAAGGATKVGRYWGRCAGLLVRVSGRTA
ncbi:hypothetical protein GCM10009760_40190 [Kitasatospora kazusensis]|uniref:Uncharacterized protein n=1 Tax=Kitasatospora kazusensis TaxID=407974 RepID=A0ABN2ZVU3_9ACTN